MCLLQRTIHGLTTSLVCALILATAYASTASTYRTLNNAIRINVNGICTLKPFSYYLERYGQTFLGAIYPDLTLIPCTKGEPIAFFGGEFQIYKVTGDRSEACRGDVSLKFNNYGASLDLQFVYRGSLPGHYCRDRQKTFEYHLLRIR